MRCKEQKTCDKGTFLNGADKTTDGTCKVCADGEFQDEDNVRTPCKPHVNTCGTGKFLDGANKKTDGTCEDCDDGTFQSAVSTRAPCTEQTKCDKGQFLDGADKAKDGTCKVCADGKFQSNDDTRALCQEHKHCSKLGERKESDVKWTKNSEVLCTPCDQDTYQDNTPTPTMDDMHTCKKQPSCGTGSGYAATSVASIRTCTDCTTPSMTTDKANIEGATYAGKVVIKTRV